MKEIKFGLCNPPEPIYLYVKSGEESGENYLWYQYEINKKQTIPVKQKALAGNLQELRLTSKLFKGKENMKIDIVINADELYVIRTGIETNFAKTFLLALSKVEDLTRPLIISVAPGNENVVFCRLYDAITRQRVKADWNDKADWASIISIAQQKLGQSDTRIGREDDTDTTIPGATPSATTTEINVINQEILSVIEQKGITTSVAQQYLKEWFGKPSRKMLSCEQLIEFRDRLASLPSMTSTIDRNLLWREIESLGNRRGVNPHQAMFTRFGASDIASMTDQQLLSLKDYISSSSLESVSA